MTKALLNLFQHCSGKVLGTFLSLLDVKGRSDTFEFDFQITGESSFSQKSRKIMLALVSSSTRKVSDPSYIVERSRPDACIYNKAFEKNWPDFKNSVLYAMKYVLERHPSGRFFTKKEIEFAIRMNSKPTYAIGIGKRYAAKQIDKEGKKVVRFFNMIYGRQSKMWILTALNA